MFVTGSGTNVILVGVHYGSGSSDIDSTRSPRFIPIDRVYADALSQAYDWESAALRRLDASGPLKGRIVARWNLRVNTWRLASYSGDGL